MRAFKPTSAAMLNPAHPLTHNLIGCWLMNEGAGGTAYDSSPNRNTGTLQGHTHFAPGRFGAGLSFDGTDDYVTLGSAKGTSATIALWCKSVNDASVKGLYSYCESGGGSRMDIDIQSTTVNWVGVYNWGLKWSLSATVDPTQWCHICVQCGLGGAKLFVNGRLAGSDSDEYCFDIWTAGMHRIGWDFFAATDRYFNGTIDHAVMFNRALTASEILELYCEPFAMFRGLGRSVMTIAASRTYQPLSGTLTATSNLSAVVAARRRMAGAVAATASVHSTMRSFRRVSGVCPAGACVVGSLSLAGIVDLAAHAQVGAESTASLSIQSEQPLPNATDDSRTPWLREVLLNGAASNTFQLGTVLTRGWFWTRHLGCTAVYRGRTLARVDFTDIVCVSDADAQTVTIPSHIRHKPGLCYCYVARRFNSRGYQERTTSAAVLLCLDQNGQQRRPMPNRVLALAGMLMSPDRIRLSWFYSLLEQETPPEAFNVYWGGGTGKVGFDHPLAAVAYEGARVYSYLSDSVPAGEHRFAVRSRSAGGIENLAPSSVTVQVPQMTCQAIQMIGAL